MSEKILKQLHPYLEYLARELKREMITRHQTEIIVYCGLRTFKSQNKLFAQGRENNKPKVTNARGGYSLHNFDEKEGSYAFDACPLKNGRCDWNNIKAFKQMAIIGKEIGLTCGAYFRSITDYPHFQYTDGLSTRDLRNGKRINNPLESAMKFEYKEKIDYIFDKKLIEGYNYVNLRELLGKLGFEVNYDVITRTVIIRRK